MIVNSIGEHPIDNKEAKILFWKIREEYNSIKMPKD